MAPITRAVIYRRFLKITAVVLGGLLTLLLIATILLLTFLEPYAARFLREQVANQTAGLYQLDFKEIEIDLFTTSLRLEQVHLYPDTVLYQKQKGKGIPLLLAIKSPEFTIKRLDLLAAIFEQHFSLGTLLLENPEIRLYLDPQMTQRQQNSNGKGNVLKSLYIGELQINKASFRSSGLQGQQVPQHHLNQLSVLVEQLQADFQQQDLSRLFKAEALQLSAENYAYHTPNKVYAVTLDHLRYDSRDQTLQLDRVAITPSLVANQALNPDSAYHRLYKLVAPQLQISELDLPAAIASKKLALQKLKLEQWTLEIFESVGKSASETSPSRSDLYALTAQYLKEISIAALHITDASLAYYAQADHKNPIHQIPKVTFALEKLQLDSATIFAPAENLPLQHITVAAENYQYLDPQNPHQAQLGRLFLSSKEKTLQLSQLLVKSDWEKNQTLKQTGRGRHGLYSLALPEAKFQGLDLKQAIKNARLHIASIALASPSLNLRLDPVVDPAPESSSGQDLYQQFSPLLKMLVVDSISVQNIAFSQFSGPPGTAVVQELEEASLQLSGLQLDSTFFYQKQLALPIAALELTATNYRYVAHKGLESFSLHRFQYHSQSQQLSAGGIRLAAKPASGNLFEGSSPENPRHYDISANAFTITGLDLAKAISIGRLEVDQVLLREPVVVMVQDLDQATAAGSGARLKSSTTGIFASFSPIVANSVKLEGGTITLHQKQDSVYRSQQLEQVNISLTDLYLNPDKVSDLDNTLPFEELTLSARDYTYRSLDSLYTITLDSLYYSSQEQQLRARLFKLISNRDAHKKIKAAAPDSASRNLFDVTARNFSVGDFDLVAAYKTGRYHLGEMVLSEPEVHILQDQNVPEKQDVIKDTTANNGQTPQNKPDTASENSAVPALMSEKVSSFQVDRIQVNRGRFEVSILKDTIAQSQLLEQVWVTMHQLRLIAMTAPDPLNMFAVSDIEVLIKDYSFLTPDSLYLFSIDEVRSSLARGLLQIDSIRLKPQYDKEAFQEKISFAGDRYDLKLAGIQLQGIDLSTLFNSQRLIADQMILSNPDVDIYRDNRRQKNLNRRPPTLQAMIRQAGLYVRLDTLAIENGQIYYTEVPPGGIKPGLLTLENMHVAIAHVTNDSTLIRQRNQATAHGSALLMGTSLLNVDFVFFLDHPEDRYTYKGTLGPMDMQAFNPLLRDMVFAEVRSGQIDTVHFSVQANRHQASGQMHFLYENLKIGLINKKNHDTRGLKLRLGTWLLNNLLVKANNPSRHGKLRGGEVEVDRLYQKSVFNHMGKAMISGVVSSLLPNWVEKIADRFTKIP